MVTQQTGLGEENVLDMQFNVLGELKSTILVTDIMPAL